jgi:sortase (surface protein transpeptidase)
VVARGAGELLVTAGVVVLLFVVYQLYITSLFSAHKQSTASTTMQKAWHNPRVTHVDPTDGTGMAKLYIPALGADYHFTVVQGTSESDLAIGPGHYTGTALPGRPGNFAVAGHRVGKGAPFNDLDLVASCDSIVVETAHDWYVYRTLPMPGEVDGWSTGRGAARLCSGPGGSSPVKPLHGRYSETPGRAVVAPSERDVIDPVPHHPGARPGTKDPRLITLTTCTPKFSAAKRLILHGVLTAQYPKDSAHPDRIPPALKEQT